MKKLITGFILGIITCSGMVYAVNYLASDISYTPADNSWDVSNVNEALDKIKLELDNGIGDLKEAQCGEFNYTGSAVNVQFENEFKNTPDRVFMWGNPPDPYLYFITLGAGATTTGFTAQYLYMWNGGGGNNQKLTSFSGTVYYCAVVYND